MVREEAFVPQRALSHTSYHNWIAAARPAPSLHVLVPSTADFRTHIDPQLRHNISHDGAIRSETIRVASQKGPAAANQAAN